MSYNQNPNQNPNQYPNKNSPIRPSDQGANDDVGDGCLYVLAILIPFVAVGIKKGFCAAEMWLCMLLTYLFYIPGVIYACIIIAREADKRRHRDVEQGGQGYATQHIPLHNQNQQPLNQHQAYPTEGSYPPQASAPRHEPAPLTQPPVAQHAHADTGISAQAPPPSYGGETGYPNEKAQYVPPSN